MNTSRTGISRSTRRGVDVSAKRIALFIIVAGLLVCFAWLGWTHFHKVINNRLDEKRVRAQAYGVTQDLKRYFWKTGHFPEILSNMVVEGTSKGHCLGPFKGCTIIYTQPEPTAANTAVVFVVTSSRLQGVVTKDFRILYKSPSPR